MSSLHDGPCPFCESATGVPQITGIPLLNWPAVTIELAAARSVLGELGRLADQATVLTDEQLRFRLLTLAQYAQSRPHAPPRSPADRWPSEAPDSAPSGQPVPHDTVGTAP